MAEFKFPGFYLGQRAKIHIVNSCAPSDSVYSDTWVIARWDGDYWQESVNEKYQGWRESITECLPLPKES